MQAHAVAYMRHVCCSAQDASCFTIHILTTETAQDTRLSAKIHRDMMHAYAKRGAIQCVH